VVEIPLALPAEARAVRLRRGGVVMTFGLTAFLTAAKARRDDALVLLVEARGGDELWLQPEDMPDPVLHDAVLFAAARLLQEGKARVVEAEGGLPAPRVLLQAWTWEGGGCRQAGRAFRLTPRGSAFLEVTDLFEDGAPQ